MGGHCVCSEDKDFWVAWAEETGAYKTQAVTARKLMCVTTESTKGKNFETFKKCRCTNYSCQEQRWHFVIKSYVYFSLLNTHTLVFPEREACNAIQ